MKTTVSIFICTQCGISFPIPRKNGKQRQKNHIKDLYCYKCNKIQKMIEHREFDFI